MGAQVQPAQPPPALRVARQRHVGVVDHQLLDAAAQQRGNREHHQRARHLQAALAARAGHAQIVHRHLGHQAVGLDREFAQGNGRAQRLRGQRLQARTKRVDSRHNEPMQCRPGQHAEQQQRAHDAYGPTHGNGKNADRKGTQERAREAVDESRPAAGAKKL
jgi:hypothetical protein